MWSRSRTARSNRRGTGWRSSAPPSWAGRVPGNPPVRFLPCLGGFVGSDILAGILATRMHESERLTALIDLGTNGEIVVGNRERLLCASTAAGPAFEGGRISMGMRAATGAISEVSVRGRRACDCRVLGHGAPRGICGSGLVDAVAAGLDLGLIRPAAGWPQGKTLPLAGRVALTQADIRELQLAKARHRRRHPDSARTLGRRGPATSTASTWRAPSATTSTAPARGASACSIFRSRWSNRPATPRCWAPKSRLFGDAGFADLRARVEHVPLGSDPEFQDSYVDSMAFPRIG